MKTERRTCLDSKLICCRTTRTAAQPLLDQTSPLFPTVLISLDTLNSSFQVSQLRQTEPCLFMVSLMTCMEVETCTISLSISETFDLGAVFMFPPKKGKSSLATTSSFACCNLVFLFHIMSVLDITRTTKIFTLKLSVFFLSSVTMDLLCKLVI